MSNDPSLSKGKAMQKALKSIREMPGPEEIKGKGHIEGDLALFQLNAHKRYGRYVKFKLDANTVAVSTTDIEVLQRCARIFNKPEKLYQFLEPLMGKLLLLPMEENKALRHITISQFSPTLIQRKFTLLIAQLDHEIAEWLSAAKASADSIIAIQDRTKALAMRLTVSLIYGKDFPQSAQLGKAIHTALEELLKLQYDKSYTQRKKLEEVLSYINATTEHFIQEKQSHPPQHNEERVFIDAVLQHYQNPAEIKNIIKEMLMASYHTIASLVTWTLYAIATHPPVAQKTYQEIEAVFKKQPFTYQTLSQLKYLDQVIKESSRRYTVGPYTAREADEELDIGGYLIPKGTTLFYPIWAVHLDPVYWPEPEVFNPERPKRSYNSAAFIPFGHGARNCPGMIISHVQIKLILAKLLQRISFQAVPDFKPDICENFVLVSKNDIHLKVSPRQKNHCAHLHEHRFAVLALFSLLLVLASQRTDLLLLFALGIGSYYRYQNRSSRNTSAAFSLYALTSQNTAVRQKDESLSLSPRQ